MIMSLCFYHEQPYELGWMCPECEAELCEDHDRMLDEGLLDDYYLESDRQFVAELERIEI